MQNLLAKLVFLLLLLFDIKMIVFAAQSMKGLTQSWKQHTHTYFRQQDFSIVPVSCSLVHQPNANYSSNLQNR